MSALDPCDTLNERRRQRVYGHCEGVSAIERSRSRMACEGPSHRSRTASTRPSIAQ
jgi:hypothetical protein